MATEFISARESAAAVDSGPIGSHARRTMDSPGKLCAQVFGMGHWQCMHRPGKNTLCAPAQGVPRRGLQVRIKGILYELLKWGLPIPDSHCQGTKIRR